MRKVRNNEGFTLAELLIVVAIIAVLVAVSIPIFTSQLEKSREATDLANQRAAKAAAVTKYLDGGDDAMTASKTYYYDAAAGILKTATTGITGYGKGTGVTGASTNKADGYNPSSTYTGKICTVKVTPGSGGSDATFTIGWS